MKTIWWFYKSIRFCLVRLHYGHLLISDEYMLYMLWPNIPTQFLSELIVCVRREIKRYKQDAPWSTLWVETWNDFTFQDQIPNTFLAQCAYILCQSGSIASLTNQISKEKMMKNSTMKYQKHMLMLLFEMRTAKYRKQMSRLLLEMRATHSSWAQMIDRLGTNTRHIFKKGASVNWEHIARTKAQISALLVLTQFWNLIFIADKILVPLIRKALISLK